MLAQPCQPNDTREVEYEKEGVSRGPTENHDATYTTHLALDRARISGLSKPRLLSGTDPPVHL